MDKNQWQSASERSSGKVYASTQLTVQVKAHLLERVITKIYSVKLTQKFITIPSGNKFGQLVTMYLPGKTFGRVYLVVISVTMNFCIR